MLGREGQISNDCHFLPRVGGLLVSGCPKQIYLVGSENGERAHSADWNHLGLVGSVGLLERAADSLFVLPRQRCAAMGVIIKGKERRPLAFIASQSRDAAPRIRVLLRYGQ